MYKEFKEFIARGNVVDLAVAVVIVRHSDESLHRSLRYVRTPDVEGGVS